MDETTAAPFLQCDCQKVRAVFKLPSLRCRERSCIPGAKWTLETGTEEEESLLLPVKLEWLYQTETILPDGAVDIFTNACSGVLAIVLYLAVIQTQSLNVKFHNQLHFKSYMHIPGHDEILGLIWFLLMWIRMHFTCSDLPREIKIQDSMPFFKKKKPSPTRHCQTVRCKILFKKRKWNGTNSSSHFKCMTTFCSETISVMRREQLAFTHPNTLLYFKNTSYGIAQT